MKIKEIKTTPLFIPFKKTYVSSYGTIDGANLILIEVVTDTNLSGYGECIASPSPKGVEMFIKEAIKHLIDKDPADNDKIMKQVYHNLFVNKGICSSPRFGGQILAGLEMALWDVVGKSVSKPVHDLIGGALHSKIDYFGFPNGDTPEIIAKEAKEFADQGHKVIYVKVGQSEEIDIEIVKQTREAIGASKRLRLDPNEKYDPDTFFKIVPKLIPYDIDFIEQPSHCESIADLKFIHQKSPIKISADQIVFTPFNVFDVCKEEAADLFVLGLHETGGISRFVESSKIAEKSKINMCLHGLYESGITTCAAMQAGAAIPNLDDGNQFMNHFLKWDIIEKDIIKLQEGSMNVIKKPGLGFTLDYDNVKKASELALSII